MAIKIDVEEARVQARKIRQVAEECDSCKGTVSRCESDAANAWKGSAGEAMAGSLRKVAIEIGNVGNDLRQAAGDLESVAKEYERTEALLKGTF